MMMSKYIEEMRTREVYRSAVMTKTTGPALTS
jgi:hypothetical protein